MPSARLSFLPRLPLPEAGEGAEKPSGQPLFFDVPDAAEVVGFSPFATLSAPSIPTTVRRRWFSRDQVRFRTSCCRSEIAGGSGRMLYLEGGNARERREATTNTSSFNSSSLLREELLRRISFPSYNWKYLKNISFFGEDNLKSVEEMIRHLAMILVLIATKDASCRVSRSIKGVRQS